MPATASADEGTSQSEEQAGFTDAQVVELEQYLNTLFAEVVVKDEQTGQLHIDYDAAKRLYPDRDLSVLSIPASQLDTSSHSGAEPLDLKDYVWCVVKGAIPFIGLLDVNWGLIRMWVRQQNWGALSRYSPLKTKSAVPGTPNPCPMGLKIREKLDFVKCELYLGKEIPKRAAKIGIKDALALSPWGVAGKLAASAVGCAIWQGW